MRVGTRPRVCLALGTWRGHHIKWKAHSGGKHSTQIGLSTLWGESEFVYYNNRRERGMDTSKDRSLLAMDHDRDQLDHLLAMQQEQQLQQLQQLQQQERARRQEQLWLQEQEQAVQEQERAVQEQLRREREQARAASSRWQTTSSAYGSGK